mmetsp:Transcript_5681/g.17548  ORF Transcript_5681/g.17548 Transcript_5681/m.17548 type:complete len:211 (+) Transcript_5681:636-1268(+)
MRAAGRHHPSERGQAALHAPRRLPRRLPQDAQRGRRAHAPGLQRVARIWALARAACGRAGPRQLHQPRRLREAARTGVHHSGFAGVAEVQGRRRADGAALPLRCVRSARCPLLLGPLFGAPERPGRSASQRRHAPGAAPAARRRAGSLRSRADAAPRGLQPAGPARTCRGQPQRITSPQRSCRAAPAASAHGGGAADAGPLDAAALGRTG